EFVGFLLEPFDLVDWEKPLDNVIEQLTEQEFITDSTEADQWFYLNINRHRLQLIERINEPLAFHIFEHMPPDWDARSAPECARVEKKSPMLTLMKGMVDPRTCDI